MGYYVPKLSAKERQDLLTWARSVRPMIIIGPATKPKKKSKKPKRKK